VNADRFDRLLPLAGALIGLLFFVGLALTWGDPSSETGPAETFSYWQDNRGQHQISGLLLAPLIAFLLVFFGAGLQRALRRDGSDSGHGAVAFGGALLAAATFALVGMLEGAATNAAHEGQRQAVYTLSQLHSYDWLAWNAAFAAVLLATGLGARRNGMLPTPARLDDDRHRRITPHATRILRLLPRSALADRGRAHPQPFCITARRANRVARDITAACPSVQEVARAPSLGQPALSRDTRPWPAGDPRPVGASDRRTGQQISAGSASEAPSGASLDKYSSA
jgi:hypothetical protein